MADPVVAAVLNQAETSVIYQLDVRKPIFRTKTVGNEVKVTEKLDWRQLFGSAQASSYDNCRMILCQTHFFKPLRILANTVSLSICVLAYRYDSDNGPLYYRNACVTFEIAKEKLQLPGAVRVTRRLGRTTVSKHHSLTSSPTGDVYAI